MNLDFFALESAPAPNPSVPTAEDIWAAYPKKKHHLYAIKCIQRAMKRVHPSRLLERTQAYAEAVSRWPENERHYVLEASTWFNKGGYDDDPATWERKGTTKGKAGFA